MRNQRRMATRPLAMMAGLTLTLLAPAALAFNEYPAPIDVAASGMGGAAASSSPPAVHIARSPYWGSFKDFQQHVPCDGSGGFEF